MKQWRVSFYLFLQFLLYLCVDLGFSFFHISFHFISWDQRLWGKKEMRMGINDNIHIHRFQEESVGIFTVNTICKVVWQCCRLLQDQLQSILRKGRE